jgi:DNA-binding MarR family transcriptional regulator
MSGPPADAQRVAESFEGLMAALLKQKRGEQEAEPPTLSAFQALALAQLADQGPVRLGALADALGTTDATASRTVDVLESRGLAERRPDPVDARGVLVAATREGSAEIRVRRRRLTKLAARALADLSPDETRRVADALDELRTLLDRA